MDTRRDFLKKAAILSGSAGLAGVLPPAIQRALAIDPAPGSTYLDAEHIVILMQENRSFDHCYGTLRGVRGFNDPRAIQLPNKNLVWLQSNKEGETYAPFRLDLKDSKATWMSSLPHSWENQVDARNGGKYDKWLDVKRSGNKEYAHLPMTMGYYTREDIPFYYALADAFTICDQNFCSSLTGTTPNRLYFWTGTLRNQEGMPAVRNNECDYPEPGSWTTYPERLEDAGISWKVYQNELSVGVGFDGEEDAWLSNFTDNPLEFFTQYKPQLSEAHLHFVQQQIARYQKELADTTLPHDERADREEKLAELKKHQEKYNAAAFAALSQREKNLHEKAFVTNKKDPDYHQLTPLRYHDGNEEREVRVPKGDVLYQFREDVKTGALPTVSWLVAPEAFSDHPGSPWYGAWYISEVMDILTQNPEVWKKTVFILAYDENDGDFDHVPPFVPPHGEGHGKASKGIDLATEFVTREQEMKKKGMEEADIRESVIGLGYRVPLVVASPWSRGGVVNSQVFDHTSTLQFLEKFLEHKTGKKVTETNISTWRRTVCGDLSSVFQPFTDKPAALTPIVRDEYIQTIHAAKFKKIPAGFKLLTPTEIAAINADPANAPYMAKQEKGTKPSSPLPYDLHVNGGLSKDKQHFEISFGTGKGIGAPFHVYAPDHAQTWAYTVAKGDVLKDRWNLSQFANGKYHLRVYGPNGFYREFKGTAHDPLVECVCKYEAKGKIAFDLKNVDTSKKHEVVIRDNGYKRGVQQHVLSANAGKQVVYALADHGGWYDFSVVVDGCEKRYAGRVETGAMSITDPVMGRTI